MIWNKLFGKKKASEEKNFEEKEGDAQPKDNAPQHHENNILEHHHASEKLPPVIEESFSEQERNNVSESLTITPIQQSSLSIAQTREHTETLTEKLFRFDDETIEIMQKASDAPKQKSRLVQFLEGLKKSRQQITGNLGSIFSGQTVSAEMLDDLEDILLESDLGTETANMLRVEVEKAKFGKNTTEQEIKVFLKQEIEKLLAPVEKTLTLSRQNKPNVIIFVGVNGSGKTTTIGKFAKHFKDNHQKVMLVAGDTFRAAAVEQLTIWGQRNDVPVFARESGADAAGLVYDAYAKAQQENIDILMIDTAGRLQNKHNLMQELLKIVRVLQKYDENLPHEIILVLDATTGQNAMRQAEVFRDMANISGLIVTKLDGSAKGGVLVSVGHKMKLPVYAVGIGENISDLRLFNAEEFSKALVGIESE